MSFSPRVLGRTGLTVGALGISASYGVPAAAIERAFEAGFTYLYWGSRRSSAFADALRHLASQRDRAVIVLQSYSRVGRVMRWSVEHALTRIKYDRADILLLGMWNADIPPRIMDEARALRARGLVRHIAVSTHNRRQALRFAAHDDISVVHVRYNAAHPGAETDLFPHLPDLNRPGIVGFTATSWGQILSPRHTPAGDRTPSAEDCYRFVLSHPAVDLCVTGPASAAHVELAIGAVERGPMTGEELAWMKRIGASVRSRALLGRTT